MAGKFLSSTEVVREQLDWGELGWCSRPAGTGLGKLVMIEVNFTEGGGHQFHKHSHQEEVIYCIQGEVEQWLGEEKRILKPGDSVSIPPNTVHASFATAGGEKLLAVLGPAIDDENGYEMVEVAGEAPWKDLR
jgi:quercetin dioxygenase-like cupin family protein